MYWNYFYVFFEYIIKLIYVFLSLDLWEFYLPYLYSCISLMGGLLLLSKTFDCFSHTLKKQSFNADLEFKFQQFAVAEFNNQANHTVFCHTYSVHSCGIVQDVHSHGSITSKADSK